VIGIAIGACLDELAADHGPNLKALTLRLGMLRIVVASKTPRLERPEATIRGPMI
jgi:hypothetical protein